MYDVTVIGFGAAGCKAAQDAVFANAWTAIFTGEKKQRKRARSTWVLHGNENMPGLYHTPTSTLIEEARQRLSTGPWAHNAAFFNTSAANIMECSEGFRVSAENGRSVITRFVVLALGAIDEQPQIPKGSGNIRPIFPYANGSKTKPPSVHYCLRCDGHLVHGKNFAVIGHSINAANVVETLMVRSVVMGRNGDVVFHPKAYLLMHGGKAGFSEERIQRLKYIGVECVPAPIVKVLGNAKQAQLMGFQLCGGRRISVPIAFVSLGMRYTAVELTDSLKKLGVKFNGENAICVSAKNETAVPGIFALGDSVANRPLQVYCHWSDSLKIIKAIEPRLKQEKLQQLTGIHHRTD